jgi:hypothetical protein
MCGVGQGKEERPENIKANEDSRKKEEEENYKEKRRRMRNKEKWKMAEEG